MNIMNTIKAMLLTSALFAASVAYSDTHPATRTFEALATTVRMPVSASGTITLRECDDCEVQSIRVTPDTQYRINEQSMPLEQFRHAIRDLQNNGAHVVNVRRDEASQTVASIFVYTD